MTLAQADVEIVKLARLLGADPEEIAYLRDIDWQDIRDVREQASATMFEGDRQQLQRVAAATKLVPAKITATIGERAFGPLLAARVTGLLEPSRAVDIAGHLPIAFLAEVAEQLDPRRASRVIAEIPPRQIAAITQELADRGDHVTMGRFVGHLSEAALTAALRSVDDAALLRTAYVVESKGALVALVAIIPDERLPDILRTATDCDLWREALDVLRHVSDEQRGRLGNIAAEQDDDVLAGLVKAAQRDNLWADVLPVTRAMSQAARTRFATLKPIQTRPVLSSIVDAATQRGLWPELLTLLPLLPAASQRRVGKLIRAFDDQTLDGLLDAIEAEDLHAEFAILTGRLAAADRRAFDTRMEALHA